MTRLYLIRHGETEWNRDNNRYCGRSDIPLSEAGRLQAERVADWLGTVRIDHVYASTLSRSVETAAAIAARHRLAVEREDDLREIDYGMWEGLVLEEIRKQYPENWRKWSDDPAHSRAGVVGETASLVYNRYRTCVRRLCDRHDADARLAIVGHSAAIRIFLTGVLGAERSAYRNLVLHNTGVCVLERAEGDGFKLLQFNAKPDAI